MNILQVIISENPPLEKPVAMSDALHLLGAIALYVLLVLGVIVVLALVIRKIKAKTENEQ